MRKITTGLLILSLCAFCVGLVLKNSIELSLCSVSEPMCINNLTSVGNAFFYGMAALSIVFFLLLFTPQSFNSWKKFAVWYVPIAAVFFVSYQGRGYFDPDPEQIYRWFSTLYVILSFVIIFKNRKNP